MKKKKENNMEMNNLQQGSNARIKDTGQIVHVKKVSEHGFALVQFRTGGEYLLLNDRLESVLDEKVRH